MRRAAFALVAAVAVASVLALSAVAGGGLGILDAGPDVVGDEPVDGGDGPTADDGRAAGDDGGATGDVADGAERDGGTDADPPGADAISLAATTPADERAAVGDRHRDAVEEGVDQGIELVQRQGVEVSQEQRAAAIEGALEGAAQHQQADIEQVQNATTGAVHGALIQDQDVNVTQTQAAVGGATTGALTQHQRANVTQLQHAAWGAAHGAIAQKQRATVEQLQIATRGAAAGAAHEAAARGERKPGKIQEAAQGAAYGVVEQHQRITVEQRQRVTIEHVGNAAAGAAAGAIQGSQRTVVEAEQRIRIEQRQAVTIKQVQKAAIGAAKGALVQRQEVSVEQTQAAARGAASGACKEAERADVTQTQTVSIAQIQEASFGAAKGAIQGSQEATVEQIQAAATGGAEGSLVQTQRANVVQVQHAATGAAEGAVESAVQRQVVEIEQVQAAARGAGAGAVTQIQVVDVVQVQVIAQGAASGALEGHQEATVRQTQRAASTASGATAKSVQSQRVSVRQIQRISEATAADTKRYAIESESDDERDLGQRADRNARQRVEESDPVEGTATVTLTDQEVDDGTVTVDSVSLSEGGFVAVHDEAVLEGAFEDTVLGVSEHLEAGDHEDVAIDLGDLSTNRTLVAVAHHDTTGDGEFAYDETDGEEDHPYLTDGGTVVADGALGIVEDAADEPPEPPEPTAELEVSDQEGDGTNLTVEEATATVDYAIRANYGDETVRSETFAADEVVEDRSLALDSPIDESTTVEVSVIDAETGEELAAEEIEYAVEPDEPAPTAELAVSDQEGDGTTLEIDEASANVAYTLRASYGGETAESAPFAADATVEDHVLELDPPVDETTTVEVSVVDRETGDELANESIEYAVEPDEPEPTAELAVSDQEGDGTNLTVDEASANVAYTVRASYDGTTAESDTVDANETIEEFALDLDPPIEESTTVEVSVIDAEADDELAAEEVEYTVEPDEPAPTAELAVSDQEGDGTTLTIEEATATVDYAIRANYGDETARSETFDANESVEGATLELEPPIEEQTEVDVGVVDPETDEEIATETIEYTVEPDEPEPAAELAVSDQEGNGTTLTIDEASATADYALQVAYDETTAETETIGAGEPIEQGVLELDPPIEETTTVDVRVVDAETDEELANESIEYAIESDEPEPDAELAVSDQAGDGTNVTVDRATANVEYAIRVEYDDATVESETIGAGETIEEGVLELDPPIEETTTVEVSLVDAETGEELAADSIEYAVEPDEQPAPTAELEVSDQEGDGTNLTVEEAQADVGYVLRASYGGATVESGSFDADETVENYALSLDPSVEESTTIEVSVVDPETDEALANETIEYVVEPDDPEPAAELAVSNQEGDGTNLTVEEAAANVDYALRVNYDGATVESDPIAAGETIEEGVLELDPPIEEPTTVDVSVVDPETGEAFVTEEIEYAVVPDEPEPTGELDVSDQEGDGTNVTIDRATATVEYAIRVSYDGATVTSDPIGADETIEEGVLELDPPIDESTTVEVSVIDAEAGDGLAAEEIEYTVEAGEPPAPTAELEVSDQEGDGTTLTIDAAQADVDYEILASYGGATVESEPIGAGETIEEGSLELDPPVEETTTVEVSLVDAETGEELAAEEIEYAVEPEPAAEVAFEDQGSDGTTVVVDEVELEEGGYVAIYDGAALADEPTAPPIEAAPEYVRGVSEYLEPGVHEDVEIELLDVPGLEFDGDRLPDGDHALAAVPHHETGADADPATATFDYVTSADQAAADRADGPYTDAGVPVFDDAVVTVDAAPSIAFVGEGPGESRDELATETAGGE